MIARQLGYVLGSVVDALVRNGFGCVGWLAVKAQPASYQDRADLLADIEQDQEVWEPQGHAEYSDGGWWFHNEDNHPFAVLDGSRNCQVCGCPRQPVRVDPLAGCDCESRQAADLEDHAWNCGARPCLGCGHPAYQHDPSQGGGIIDPCTVCDCLDCLLVRRDTTIVDERAAKLLDHIEALLEFHRPGFDSRDGLHCACGVWCLNVANHRAHQARVVADMVEADGRITDGLTQKKAQP